MRKVTLEYKRLLRWVNTDIMVPESWRELSASQFVAVCHLYLGDGSEESFISAFFSLPLGIIRRMDSYHRFKLSELVQWISDFCAPHNTFLIPELSGHLYAPDPKLKGVCLQQFVMADTFFIRYMSSKDDMDLNRMISCLYLRSNECFFIEQAPTRRHWWNKDLKILDIEERSGELSSLNKDLRYAIFLNFILIKNWLSKAFPYLFQESGDTPPVKKHVKPPVNWIKVLDAFVGDKITEYDKFLMLPATTAFRIMNTRIMEGLKHGR